MLKMSEVVGIVLKMSLSLFVDKARSSLSDQLKDGGLDSQQLRNLVVSKLQNLEKKLDGLARASLLSSVSRVQEGLRLLGDLLDKPSTPTLLLQEDDRDDSARASGNFAQSSSSKSKSALDVDSALKLAQVIDELKRSSGDHFTSAIELFKEANTKATEAFHNEALSIDDRIRAAKIRVQSRLLSSLENPSLTSQPCRLYLEELHDLPPIVKDFRKHLEGGMVSVLNSEKRRKLVLSVSAINLVVFKFLKSFAKDPVNLYNWPNVSSEDWTYNPLIPDKTIYLELQNAAIEFPNLFVPKDVGFTNKLSNRRRGFAVNSDGQLIGEAVLRDMKIKEDHKTVKLNDFRWHILAIDSNDITYLLFLIYPSACSFTLSPFSIYLVVLESYKFSNTPIRPVKLDECDLEDAPVVNSTPDGFALVRKEKYSAGTYKVAFYQNSQGNVTCRLAYNVEVNPKYSWLTAVTSKYQLVAAEMCGYHVRVYKEDGQLIREFELYGGKDESCVSIAFNYLAEEVVFVSSVGHWFYLSTYELETGKLRHKARLTLFGECRKTEFSEIPILKHSSGFPS